MTTTILAAVDTERLLIVVGVLIGILAFLLPSFWFVGWMDNRFVSRREWERIVTDNARHEKMMEHMTKLVNAIERMK